MKKILGLILSLTLISGICAAVLALVNDCTAEAIGEIAARREAEAVLAVLPSGTAKVVAQGECFEGRDAAGTLTGYAAKGGDDGGYGGRIELMVGFEKDAQTVVGYRVLAAAETPGLGMKLKEAGFADQFAGRDGRGLKVQKDGGEVEAITSATITSRAVCRAIADAAAKIGHHGAQ